jgi:hypothetical protein
LLDWSWLKVAERSRVIADLSQALGPGRLAVPDVEIADVQDGGGALLEELAQVLCLLLVPPSGAATLYGPYRAAPSGSPSATVAD